MILNDLQDNIVCITGGTSGIGLAAAQIFLQNGARVALIGRNPDKGKQALQKFDDYRNNVIYLQGDVQKASNCKKIIEQIVEWFGGIDTVVNSAGVYLEKAITEVTDEEYDEIMDINVKGTYFISKYAVPELKKRKAGSIINVSSDAGTNGNLFCTTYCAAKGAINTFTKALAMELAPYHIRVNGVCPGDIYTPLLEKQLAQADDADSLLREMTSIYPMGRIGYPEEVAHVICFLASSQASFVTGALWAIDGGLTAC